ncbi:MAG: sigma-54 dependent transcriptional regulator [Bacteroidota bacterium]
MARKDGRILLVDDDPEVLLSGRLLLKRHFAEVQTLNDPKRINKLLKEEAFDVVLLDMNFQRGNTDGDEGLRWVEKINQLQPDLPVVMITAYGHVDMAVKAMKAGATDFVSKPWQNEKLLATVKSAFQLSKSKQAIQQLQARQQSLSEELDTAFGPSIIGKSAAMLKVFNTLEKVAKTDADVLILGENGTGKELIARSLHRQSHRQQEVFIKVDLGALPESLFESELFGHKKGAFTDAHADRQGRFLIAAGGSLFLDEIGNLSMPLQAKLLTVLQSRKVTPVGSHKPEDFDIRLICATNKPLYEMVKEGSFRQDLLYRINTVEVTLPPLRERVEDIPLLVEHFLSRYRQKYGKKALKLTLPTRKKLQRYPWPGNIRELEHAVERAVILGEGPYLHPEDFVFREELTQIDPEPDNFNLHEMEKRMIQKALHFHQGNISKAAQDLGLTRAALYRRMEKYDL